MTPDRRSNADSEEQVRRKMEETLSDHGLKELILQQIRSQR